MKKLYKVTLTDDEPSDLLKLVSTGKSSATNIKHANILLVVDETENGRVSDQDVAKQFHCHTNAVANVRERFVEEGLEATIERKQRETPPTSPIFDGRAEAHLRTTAISLPQWRTYSTFTNKKTMRGDWRFIILRSMVVG